MSIRTLIADDEPLARSKMRFLLESEAGVEIVAECADGQQAIRAIREFRPDLLLLDIEMPGATGFDVLQALEPKEIPIVIFVTAYDEYAVRAFEASALDYLLKPFDRERLHRSIERARQQLNARREFASEEILRFLNHPLSRNGSWQRLVIKSAGRVVFLEVDEIEWIEAAANYVRIHAGKEVHLMRESISRIAEKLDPSRFVRIHRSAIVNVMKIRELQACNSGEYMVILRNGKELPCSRGYRSALEPFISRSL
jgi:two-component system, LytTR family, response regulator